MKKLVVAAVMAAVSMTAISACMADGNLAKMYRGRDIKVYVNDFTNESGNNNISVSDFKKDLQKAFENRRSSSFKIVDNPAASDVQISGIIKQFQYLKTGPVKPSVSVVTTAIDVAATALENYADMNVNLAVVDSKTGNTLWKDDVYDFERRVMSEAQSVPLVFEKVARKCVAKSFGKPD